MPDFNRALIMAVKTGKVLFGANTAIRSAMTGKVRLIIVALNCSERLRLDLAKYCNLSKIPFKVFPRTSLELGRICGKPFVVSALAIRDPGDSDILKMVAESDV